MKRFKFASIIALFIICGITLLPARGQAASDTFLRDSLNAYTGKYQMHQGNQQLYAEVYIEKGNLVAKSADGRLLQLKHISGDNFIVAGQNLPVKFIRNGDNKVFQIAINDIISWNRVENQPALIMSNIFNSSDYLGKYQLKAGNQPLVIEISLKNNQLWATQLWDGGSSALDFKATDNFIVNALSMPLKFIRDKNNKVIQILINNRDLFTKVN
jgi:hypothetical protein